MPHQHVTVTLEAETVERIEAELDGGESVAAWLRAAAEERLDATEADATGDAGTGSPGRDDAPRHRDDGRADASADRGDPRGDEELWNRSRDGDDDPDEHDEGDDVGGPPLEFVDDCLV